MRRPAPRPLGAALDRAVAGAQPPTLLARVQGAWAEAAGPALAAEAQPVSERDGAVTVACSSAVWAAELELLGPELLDRLNQRLAGSSDRSSGSSALPDDGPPTSAGRRPLGTPVRRLRFVVGSGPNSA
jgi:hypothetical protein